MVWENNNVIKFYKVIGKANGSFKKSFGTYHYLTLKNGAGIEDRV